MNVLIYRSGGIGDVILSTVSLTILKTQDSIETIYWLGKQPSLGLIEKAFPLIVPIEVHSERSYLKNIKSILQVTKEVDLILDLQCSGRSLLICSTLSLIRKAKFYTWKKRSLARTMDVWRSRLKVRGECKPRDLNPQLTRYALMRNVTLQALSLKDSLYHSFPRMDIKEEQIERHFQLDSQIKWMSVSLDALHPAKRAPKKIFEDALLKLSEKGIFGVVLLGQDIVQKPSQELECFLKKLGILTVNFVGKTTLWEAALLMKQSKVSFFNDTSLAHLSEAVQTPVAMLFGPTSEGFGYAPYLPKSRAFSFGLSCRPCSKDGSTECRYGDYLCFFKISSQEISDFLHQSL